MFETETFGPYLVRKLKWEGVMAPLAPPAPPSGYATDSSCYVKQFCFIDGVYKFMHVFLFF